MVTKGGTMNKLRKLRQCKNLSIKEVAEKLGLTRNAISQYENGRRTPSIKIMQNLSEVLDVDLQTIVKCFTKDNKEEE